MREGCDGDISLFIHISKGAPENGRKGDRFSIYNIYNIITVMYIIYSECVRICLYGKKTNSHLYSFL